MKSLFLPAILIFNFFLFAKANENCSVACSKSGVTIRYTAPCNSDPQSSINKLLEKVVALLNRRDTSLKILVLVNQGQLSFPGRNTSDFISIGYDTLRSTDDSYILEYYTNQETISTRQNHGFSTFESKRFPIDINSTKSRSTNNIGVKIIYDRDHRWGEPIWSDIISAVEYAANNADIVQTSQRRDTVRYNKNGWYVSLVMLDTVSINKILGKTTELSPVTKPASASHPNYFIPVLLALFIVATLFVAGVLIRKRR